VARRYRLSDYTTGDTIPKEDEMTTPRASTCEQDGQYAGQEIGRVFFTASGLRPTKFAFVGLGSVADAREVATALNGAGTDAAAQLLWDAVVGRWDEVEGCDVPGLGVEAVRS
jgi:hypothetical protein